MRYRMPDYYGKFECIADKCPMTCCKGWGIVIDDKSFEKYNSHTEKKDYICEHIDAKEQMFRQNGDRCSFLNCDNLCDLYINVGEEYLCNTCRRYPRHFEFYGDLIEGALSMSCPVAAEYILSNENSNRFLVRDVPDKKRKDKEVDSNLLNKLLIIRKSIIDKVKSSCDLYEALKQILIYGERIQDELYKYERLGLKSKFNQFRAKSFNIIDSVYSDFINNKIRIKSLSKSENNISENYSRKYYFEEYIDMLLGLENINDEWPIRMERLKSTLYNLSEEEYNDVCHEFGMYMAENMYEYRNIFVYFIYTYFLGSIYDYNLQAMIKFSIFCVLIIREWEMANWLNKGKKLSKKDREELCYLFSRQIEHSDNNLTSLEGIMTAHPMFSAENFVKVL